MDRKRKIDVGGAGDEKRGGGGGGFSSTNPYLAAAMAAPGPTARLTAAEVEAAMAGERNSLTGRPFSSNYRKVLATRKKLPVYQFLDDLLEKVRENQTAP